MNSLAHRIVSPFLALLVLLSTVSWTVDKHRCMGRLMDVAFFSHAEDCGMEATSAIFGYDKDDNHCCSDESVTIKGQDIVKTAQADYELLPPLFFEAPHLGLDYQLPVYSTGQDLPRSPRPPPLPKQGLLVLYQVFLI